MNYLQVLMSAMKMSGAVESLEQTPLSTDKRALVLFLRDRAEDLLSKCEEYLTTSEGAGDKGGEEGSRPER